jgi:hypothetical protein
VLLIHTETQHACMHRRPRTRTTHTHTHTDAHTDTQTHRHTHTQTHTRTVGTSRMRRVVLRPPPPPAGAPRPCPRLRGSTPSPSAARSGESPCRTCAHISGHGWCATQAVCVPACCRVQSATRRQPHQLLRVKAGATAWPHRVTRRSWPTSAPRTSTCTAHARTHAYMHACMHAQARHTRPHQSISSLRAGL